MTFAPIFSLMALCVGFIALPLVAWVRFLRPYARFLVPVAVGFSLLGVVATRFAPSWSMIFSRWHPSVFFNAVMLLEDSPVTWPLLLAFSVAMMSSALIQLGRLAPSHILVGLATLGMMAAVLGSLWGSNLLVVLMCWGSFDLFWSLGMLAVGASTRRVALAGGVFVLSTTALLTGALVTRTVGGSISWALIQPGELERNLLVVAAVLRLAFYPLHLTVPVGVSKSAPAAMPLYLGPVLGWGLLLRLVVSAGVSLDDLAWVQSIGMASLIAGGLLAWTRAARSEVLPWIALASSGATLWASAVAGERAALVLAGGSVAWLLGMTLVSLARGWERAAPWWSIGPVVGGLALIGSLLTPGVLVGLTVAGRVVEPFDLRQAFLFFLGESLLVAGTARRVLVPIERQERGTPLAIAARAAGLALPTVLLLWFGLYPAALSPAFADISLGHVLEQTLPAGWAVWLLGFALGVPLFLLEGRLRKRIEPGLGLLFDLVALDWVLYTLLGGLGRVADFLREVAELVEGAGAVLWAFAIFLLLALAFLGI
ncbi:MAG: hypothetical protein JXD18_13545 [Anaerolineae bacterium]|nr:hypothetical protein [Anaerolineae bacterium]